MAMCTSLANFISR